jgi:hypothetical protein
MRGAPLEQFLAAGPWPQRGATRLLVELARRPRGRILLRRVPLAHQTAVALRALGDYDEPAIARALGWDARAVVDRGRELRRSEARP